MRTRSRNADGSLAVRWRDSAGLTIDGTEDVIERIVKGHDVMVVWWCWWEWLSVE